MSAAHNDLTIVAYLLMWAKRYELSVGPGAWIVLDRIARDVAMGSITAAILEGALEPYWAPARQLLGAGEETQPQPKDVED